MSNADARKFITEQVLPASPARSLARRCQEGTGKEATDKGAIAAESTAPPYSPIVLAGSVRLFELLVVFLAGVIAYLSCIWPFRGFDWIYVAVSACIATIAM